MQGEHLDSLDDAVDPAAVAGVDLVGQAQDTDGQRHVPFHRRHHVGRGRLTSIEQAHDLIAGRGQRGKCFERLEGSRQPAPMTLVVVVLVGGVGIGGTPAGDSR